MTRNQLQYWANRETARSNRANETERQRANLEQERLKSRELTEMSRRNRADESLRNAANLIQQNRNLNDYRIQSQANSIAAHRAGSDRISAATSQMNAVTNRINASTNQSALLETTRHNKQTETTSGFGTVGKVVSDLLNVGVRIGGILK